MFPIRCASIRLTRSRLFDSYLSSFDFRKALPPRLCIYRNDILPAIISAYNYSIMHYRNLIGLRYGYISVKKVLGNKEMRLIFINRDSIFTEPG
jgi:hypothetical protein